MWLVCKHILAFFYILQPLFISVYEENKPYSIHTLTATTLWYQSYLNGSLYPFSIQILCEVLWTATSTCGHQHTTDMRTCWISRTEHQCMSTNKGCDVPGVLPGRLDLLLDNTFALLLHNFFTYSVHQLSSVCFIPSSTPLTPLHCTNYHPNLVLPLQQFKAHTGLHVHSSCVYSLVNVNRIWLMVL